MLQPNYPSRLLLLPCINAFLLLWRSWKKKNDLHENSVVSLRCWRLLFYGGCYDWDNFLLLPSRFPHCKSRRERERERGGLNNLKLRPILCRRNQVPISAWANNSSAAALAVPLDLNQRSIISDAISASGHFLSWLNFAFAAVCLNAGHYGFQHAITHIYTYRMLMAKLIRTWNKVIFCRLISRKEGVKWLFDLLHDRPRFFGTQCSVLL